MADGRPPLHDGLRRSSPSTPVLASDGEPVLKPAGGTRVAALSRSPSLNLSSLPPDYDGAIALLNDVLGKYARVKDKYRVAKKAVSEQNDLTMRLGKKLKAEKKRRKEEGQLLGDKVASYKTRLRERDELQQKLAQKIMGEKAKRKKLAGEVATQAEVISRRDDRIVELEARVAELEAALKQARETTPSTPSTQHTPPETPPAVGKERRPSGILVPISENGPPTPSHVFSTPTFDRRSLASPNRPPSGRRSASQFGESPDSSGGDSPRRRHRHRRSSSHDLGPPRIVRRRASVAAQKDFDTVTAEPGLRVWRIEEMVPVEVQTEDLGNFFVGDSYIVLYVPDKGEAGSANSGGAAEVYFWVGSESTRDEYTTASIQGARLAQKMACRVRREEQGEESDGFRKAFWFGITYLEGGVDGGLKPVLAASVSKLYVVLDDGKRGRVFQIPARLEALTEDAVFVLDTGTTLYQFIGTNSRMRERATALALLAAMREERGPTLSREIVPRSPPALALASLEHYAPFWVALGYTGPTDGSAAASDLPGLPESGHRTAEGIAELDARRALLRIVSDGSADGAVEEPEARRPLKQRMLDSDGVCVVDSGGDVFVWVGRNAPSGIQTPALNRAHQVFLSVEREAWSSIMRVRDGREPCTFQANFKKFKINPPPTPTPSRPTSGRTSPAESADGDHPPASLVSASLPAHRSLANAVTGDSLHDHTIETVFVDTLPTDGRASTMLFGGPTAAFTWPEPLACHFFSGNIFVVLYVYMTERVGAMPAQRRYFLYMWVGRDADPALRLAFGFSLCRHLEESFEKAAVMPACKPVVVYQGSEPDHLYKIMREGLIVHDGDAFGRVPLMRRYMLPIKGVRLPPPPADATPDTIINPGVMEAAEKTQLFRIQGSEVTFSHTTEVAPSVASLCPQDVFILIPAEGAVTYMWLGAGVGTDQVEAAVEVVHEVQRLAHVRAWSAKKAAQAGDDSYDDSFDASSGSLAEAAGAVEIVTVIEGSEPREFWANLEGDQRDYRPEAWMGDPELRQHFFRADISKEGLAVAEVRRLGFNDFGSRDIVIVDVYNWIWVWSGRTASIDVVTRVRALFDDYAASCASERSVGPQIAHVRQGEEPAALLSFFPFAAAIPGKAFVDPRERIAVEARDRDRTTRRALRKAFKDGVCSTTVTGDEAVIQGVWTCDGCGDAACCAMCMDSCHRGHARGQHAKTLTVCTCSVCH